MQSPRSTKAVVCLAAGLLVTMVGCVGKTNSTPAPPASQSSGLVTIEVKTEKGTQAIKVENIAAGTTVEEVMRSIDHVEVVISGSGATAFLNQIGDLETAGGEGWMYEVDGEHAHEGIGTQKLDPPTTITWFYGAYQGE